MKRHLRTVLFAIAAAVLGVVVQKFVLRKDGSPVLAAVVGAIVGALASLGGGTDGKGEAETARRGKPERSGEAPPEIGGTEDAIEERAQLVASEEPEVDDRADAPLPAPDPVEPADAGGEAG